MNKMRSRHYFLYGILGLSAVILFPRAGGAQVIASFTVHDGPHKIAAPVSVDLDRLTDAPDSVINLVRIAGKKRTAVPFQIEHGDRRMLWWTVKNEGGAEDIKFELMKGKAPESRPVISYRENDGGLELSDHGRSLLRYNYATVYPPEGVDSVFKRSGFIHPLWSPDGTVLTRINPWDHRHHFGIWNPWTHVLFRGETKDFWNLAKKEGTVRFGGFISKTSGPVFGGFRALQEHVVFDTADGRAQDKTAIHEEWNVRAYNIGKDMWLWDLTSVLNCATEDPVLLEKYDYGGGLSFRATEAWSKDASQALTSAGKDRNNGNGTTARWCMIDGKSKDGRSGILFMSSPQNYNAPQPIRIYPQDWFNGLGELFFCFTPTLTTDWLLTPGRNYVQRYRVLVYSGKINKEEAEAVWQSFAYPPDITIHKP